MMVKGCERLAMLLTLTARLGKVELRVAGERDSFRQRETWDEERQEKEEGEMGYDSTRC